MWLAAYYDDNPERSLLEKVDRVCDLYTRKFKRPATLVLLNPADYAPLYIPELVILAMPSVLHHMFYAGQTKEEKPS